MGKLFLAVMTLILGLGWMNECRAITLDRARSWAYQLQNADPVSLAASRCHVVVMDYSRDGTEAGAYSAQEIQLIKDAGKIALCYLSIGEAESYRFYWKTWWKPGNPFWLGPVNPDWPGNYKVRYWDPQWWRIALKPYLHRIMAAGFSGVYLDIVDAYWYWHEDHRLSLDFTSREMVELVTKIATYARAGRPGFVVCPQNGESIIDDVPSGDLRTGYLDVIDAIGVEDLFYHYGDPADRRYRFNLLRLYARAGKKIFNVEYINKAKWNAYRRAVCSRNFEIVPYGALPDRELDELVRFPRLDCAATSPTGER